MAADGLHFAQCVCQLLAAVMFGLFFPTIWGFSRKGKDIRERCSVVASPKILRVFIKLALLVTWEEVSFLGTLVSCRLLMEWSSGQPCSLFFALLGPAGKQTTFVGEDCKFIWQRLGMQGKGGIRDMNPCGLLKFRGSWKPLAPKASN